MASYRDKINQRKLETESGKIAFAIEMIDRDWKLKCEARRNTLELYDGYSIESDGSLSWVINKFENGEDYYKILPKDSTYSVYESVLNAQPWTCY